MKWGEKEHNPADTMRRLSVILSIPALQQGAQEGRVAAQHHPSGTVECFEHFAWDVIRECPYY